MHFAAFVGAQKDGSELSSHPIIFCQRILSSAWNSSRCQHRCRYEDFHATSNTEEIIIEGEKLWVDTSTDVATRTSDSMLLQKVKKSSLKVRDCVSMPAQVSL